jgi:anaerobic magnesium-protoporphyrin IX monomethyl ester cyclase
MDILLINPYLTNATYNESSAPLGLLTIISYVREQIPNCNIEFLDLVAHSKGRLCQTRRGRRLGPDDDEIRQLVSKLKPDVIGVPCMFTSFADDSYELIDLLREIFPDAFVVMGGAHVSYEEDEALLNSNIDAVVLKEGEITFVELLRTIEVGGDLTSVKGIAFKEGDDQTLTYTQPRPNHRNLDDFPQPAYDLYDFDFYSKSIIKGQLLKGKRIGFLFTSRGCPYDCVFCSTKVMWTRVWRAQSAERVFSDMKYLVREFGVDEFIINDDSFIVDRKRVDRLCELIIQDKLKIHIHIQAGVTIWLLSKQLLKKMTKAGLYRLRLPVETGCETTLKYINKPVDLKKSLEMIPYLHKLGLWVAGNFIIGFPNETLEEIWETIKYAEESTIDDITYLIAQPYAGADMYSDYQKMGLLEQRLDQSSYTRTLYDTKWLKAHEIQELKLLADSRFSKRRLRRLTSPRYLATTLWPKVNSFGKFKYALRIARAFLEVTLKNIILSDNQLMNRQSGTFDKSVTN